MIQYDKKKVNSLFLTGVSPIQVYSLGSGQAYKRDKEQHGISSNKNGTNFILLSMFSHFFYSC